jgi:hypothetical protein
MKAYGVVDVYIHILLTSALVAGEWSAPRPGRFIPITHCIGDLADRRAGPDDMEKRKFFTLSGLGLRPHGRPARNHSLYRLLYRQSALALKYIHTHFVWSLCVLTIMNMVITRKFDVMSEHFWVLWTSTVMK